MDRARTEGEEEAIPAITPTELKERMDRRESLLLVDVREPFEKDLADLPDYERVRIPMDDFEERAGELDPDRELVLYCRSGARSGWATRYLRERGYSRAFNLEGGVLGWREEVDPSLDTY